MAVVTMNAFERWAFNDAPWWKCWRPQSGLIGGLFAGAIVVTSLEALLS